MTDGSEKRSPHSIVSIQDSSSPEIKKTKVTIDGVLAKIVIFEKEDLTDLEICRLLNVASFTKAEVDKHFDRVNGEDKHRYTVYNILI